MRLISFYIALLQAGRALQIIGIVVGMGFSEMIDHLRLKFRKKRKGRVHITTAQRIRATIEKLGPTYIKFGQLLADRPDLVAKNFRDELKKLQSYAKPFDSSSAIDIIEKSLGGEIESYFLSFNPTPIASASIGQVYEASLLDGESVVIKVQRPFIENKIKLDIYLMKFLARKLARNYPELAAINIAGLVEEFSLSLTRELDYRGEEANLKLFAELFKNDRCVVIPKVYDNFTTRNILVMEKIGGVSPSDLEELKSEGISLEMVAKRGADTIIKMILEFGVFHADPHPGNLFIGKGGVIGIVDFGMVGVLRPREIDFIADFIVGYSLKDEAIITRSLLTLCNIKFFKYRDELKYDIKRMLLQNMSSSSVDMQNFSAIIQKSIDILIKHSLQIPSGIFLIVKTFATLEKFSLALYPGLDLAPIVMPYAKKVISNRYSSSRFSSDFFEMAINYYTLIKELPTNIGEIIYKLKEGKIKHEIRLEDDLLFGKVMRAITGSISYVLAIIGLFIGSSILIIWNSDSRFAHYSLYLSSVLIAIFLLRRGFRKRG